MEQPSAPRKSANPRGPRFPVRGMSPSSRGAAAESARPIAGTKNPRQERLHPDHGGRSGQPAVPHEEPRPEGALRPVGGPGDGGDDRAPAGRPAPASSDRLARRQPANCHPGARRRGPPNSPPTPPRPRSAPQRLLREPSSPGCSRSGQRATGWRERAPQSFGRLSATSGGLPSPSCPPRDFHDCQTSGLRVLDSWLESSQ